MDKYKLFEEITETTNFEEISKKYSEIYRELSQKLNESTVYHEKIEIYNILEELDISYEKIKLLRMAKQAQHFKQLPKELSQTQSTYFIKAIKKAETIEKMKEIVITAKELAKTYQSALSAINDLVLPLNRIETIITSLASATTKEKILFILNKQQALSNILLDNTIPTNKKLSIQIRIDEATSQEQLDEIILNYNSIEEATFPIDETISNILISINNQTISSKILLKLKELIEINEELISLINSLDIPEEAKQTIIDYITNLTNKKTPKKLIK